MIRMGRRRGGVGGEAEEGRGRRRREGGGVAPEVAISQRRTPKTKHRRWRTSLIRID